MSPKHDPPSAPKRRLMTNQTHRTLHGGKGPTRIRRIHPSADLIERCRIEHNNQHDHERDIDHGECTDRCAECVSFAPRIAITITHGGIVTDSAVSPRALARDHPTENAAPRWGAALFISLTRLREVGTTYARRRRRPARPARPSSASAPGPGTICSAMYGVTVLPVLPPSVPSMMVIGPRSSGSSLFWS